MASLNDLAKFFPTMYDKAARGAGAEDLREAFEKDAEALRGQGLIGPIEHIEGMVTITETNPPQVGFREGHPAVARLLRS